MYSHIKRAGLLVGISYFKFKPYKTPIWTRLELYLTPKRYNLKRNRFHYQLQFRKEACAGMAGQAEIDP